MRNVVASLSHSNVLLLHGKLSYSVCGAQAIIPPLLAGINVSEWADFSTNPKVEDVQRGRAMVVGRNIDLIIAVGGGSVIDIAKLISLKEDGSALPIIAIPTTAGTGSEATQFAVLWDGDKKSSVDNEKLLPKCAIIDPIFLENQPADSATAPLADALGQAIESYWCVNSTDESKLYASQAISLILPTIGAVKPDYLARALGAHLAGKAINITRTTAAHSISYAFTAYSGLAHGHAVMLTLPTFFIFNSGVSDGDCLDTRGVEYVQCTMDELNKMLGCSNAVQSATRLADIAHTLGLELQLGKLGYDDKACEYIVQHGFNPQRVKNNPRLLTETALATIIGNLC